MSELTFPNETTEMDMMWPLWNVFDATPDGRRATGIRH